MGDQIEGRPITPRLQRLYRTLERLATHTIAVSSATADRLNSWGIDPARVSTVELGIDLDALAFDPAARARVRAEWGLACQDRVIGAVGRLAPVKRFDVLIEALAPLLRSGGYRLVIVGQGPRQAALQETARWAGVTDRVLFAGARPDMAACFNAFDVFASASRDETFGLAAIEAVANGLPVAFAQCPAIEELHLNGPTPVQVSTTVDLSAEAKAWRDAISTLGPLGRGPVPEALNERYAARARTADVEQVYRGLLATASPASSRC